MLEALLCSAHTHTHTHTHARTHARTYAHPHIYMDCYFILINQKVFSQHLYNYNVGLNGDLSNSYLLNRKQH